jgi:replicative DNA helicase
MIGLTGEEAEERLARDIATRFDPESAERESLPTAVFSFDAAAQTKIAALAVRDVSFGERTEGLLRPEYFENAAEATLVHLTQKYFAKYRRLPDMVTLTVLIKDGLTARLFRKDLMPEIRTALIAMRKVDIADRDFWIEKVSEFARYQAMSKAILDSVELIERGEHDKAFGRIKAAMEVGAVETQGAYDYWSEVSSRTATRIAEASGELKPRGITTGIRFLDKVLKHHGWGRKELSALMGGPKAGKSIGLGTFARNASLAGHNVLFCSLEVSSEINSDRVDASIAEIAINELGMDPKAVESKITLAAKKAGRLIMHEYPSGTMTPTMLRRLIRRYQAQGTRFDLVVVDYADIMAPDFRTTDSIENSKSIYLALRAIAQEEGLAMLTATQTNREGAKANTAKMDHAADDFNKVRIVDLLISINRTDDEKAKNEARLYFAASRNQKGDFSIRVRQDMEKAIFIARILGVE